MPEREKAYLLPVGSFSKTFTGKDKTIRAVAYNTPSQSVALFEGDSANVWQRIFDTDGHTETAWTYILENGHFKDNPEEESKSILNEFITSLCDANLLVDSSQTHSTQSFNLIPTIRNAIDARENAEMEIAQFMADNHIFYSLSLELTYRCNERCIHCYCPENREASELTTPQISALLDEFQSMGGMSLLITGGEVFARNDIKPILRDLRQRNMVVSVISNLTMADEEDLELLTSLHPRSVGCSIYSANPELHDSITRISGSWRRSIQALRELKARGVPVLMKSPLMKHTIHGWREIETLADEIGCEVQFDVNITPRNDEGQSPIDLRVKDKAALEDLYSSRHYRIYGSDGPISITPETAKSSAILCGAGSIGLTVSPDGTIRACIGLMNELGKWPQQSLHDVWKHSSFFAQWASHKLTDIEKCSTCQYFSFCNRCPGAWQLETGSEKAPADYTCYLAQIWSSCGMKISV